MYVPHISSSYALNSRHTILPFLWGSKWLFQLENASCPTSKSTKEWLKKERKNKILSSRSPDLNPTKAHWVKICRKFYVNNKYFRSANELAVVIVNERKVFDFP